MVRTGMRVAKPARRHEMLMVIRKFMNRRVFMVAGLMFDMLLVTVLMMAVPMMAVPMVMSSHQVNRMRRSHCVEWEVGII